MPSFPVMVRMDEQTKSKAEEQASKLGLNMSEYIRLIINLDASTSIINTLRKANGGVEE